MTHAEICWAIAAGALLGIYLVVRFNGLWIYRLFDRSLKNSRVLVPPQYERPRYFEVDAQGNLETKKRWPGWDGWYFFVIPDDESLPVKMIRGSLMTGLYGLNGIDDYARLPRGAGSFHAVEHLTLTPSEGDGNSGGHAEGRGDIQRDNRLEHSYFPKPCLRMDLQKLNVEIQSAESSTSESRWCSGRIEGAWPEYRFVFRDSASGLEFDLKYTGKDLVWWADVPGVFTYFAAFGHLAGTMKYSPPKNSSATANPREQITLQIRGAGAFEHGCARKPFNFDWLYLPVRAVQAVIPSFRPVHYHYQLLVGEGGLRGGFMFASGFGIEFRNRGGLYVEGRYIPLEKVKIQYSVTQESAAEAATSPGKPKFPKAWTVNAATADGEFVINVTRAWPPARIADNMIYYNHSFEGTFQGKRIRGSGYGEYLNI
jgi:hypothetical protein